MDFKIFVIADLKIDLLIRRDYTDGDMPCVVITFFDKPVDDDEYQIEEVVEFEFLETAQKYVRDFSPASAQEFVECNLRRPVLD